MADVAEGAAVEGTGLDPTVVDVLSLESLLNVGVENEVVTLAAKDGFNVERVSVERGAVLPLVSDELDVFGELAKEVLGLAEDGG